VGRIHPQVHHSSRCWVCGDLLIFWAFTCVVSHLSLVTNILCCASPCCIMAISIEASNGKGTTINLYMGLFVTGL